MNQAIDKLTDLRRAVSQYVTKGCHLSIGGFTINRNPMAAVYEIIRQGISGLHVYAHSNGQGIDELIGGGCVDRLEIAYGGSGRFAPTCVRFRKAVENQSLLVEDYSNYQMSLRFMAGAMGVPFLPTRSGLGADLVDRWGFSEALRKGNPKLPDKKLEILPNPFGTWQDATRLVAVPAINPDVTIIHVQQADAQGNLRIKGLPFADIEQAKAAQHVIATCEELVETKVLRQAPDQNQIPYFCVDAVVPIQFGAYPTACYHYYDYDPVFLNEYRQTAQDDTLYHEYLTDRIRSTQDHSAFLNLIGEKRLKAIQADPRTGYASDLDRR